MAIYRKQFYKICDKQLGLRSENDYKSINGTGASYAMDMGLEYSLTRDNFPDWDNMLKGTIETMKAFDNSKNRYLLIVSRSSSADGSVEYNGCFPKCSVRATEIHASAPLSMDTKSLCKWVEDYLNK